MSDNFLDVSYWEKRGETYKDLDDVNSHRTSYKIASVIKTLGLNLGAWILDAGCGPGQVTEVIRSRIRHSNVIGVDISKKMIELARAREKTGLRFICEDFFTFINNIQLFFNLVTMNLFIHHLIDGRDQEAVDKAYLSLKDNGSIFISEAIPPEEEIFDYYEEIFKIKENRNCYLLQDLLKLVRNAGFVDLQYKTYRFDIKLLSWLNDRTLTNEKRILLYLMHTESSSVFKKAYAMEPLVNGDYRLRCKMAMIVGRKS
jgi:SAM-dependent methyltransferase